jgi:hypothetical protein
MGIGELESELRHFHSKPAPLEREPIGSWIRKTIETKRFWLIVSQVARYCSLIAFNPDNDLGLGPQQIVARCSINGNKGAAVERGRAASAG